MGEVKEGRTRRAYPRLYPLSFTGSRKGLKEPESRGRHSREKVWSTKLELFGLAEQPPGLPSPHEQMSTHRKLYINGHVHLTHGDKHTEAYGHVNRYTHT